MVTKHKKPTAANPTRWNYTAKKHQFKYLTLCYVMQNAKTVLELGSEIK